MVDRYFFDSPQARYPHPEGDWVEYEDYKRLEDALKEILAAKNAPHYGDHYAAWERLWETVEKHEHLVGAA
jgi:hypothetical protein